MKLVTVAAQLTGKEISQPEAVIVVVEPKVICP
jgi:hypothetical protein